MSDALLDADRLQTTLDGFVTDIEVDFSCKSFQGHVYGFDSGSDNQTVSM